MSTVRIAPFVPVGEHISEEDLGTAIEIDTSEADGIVMQALDQNVRYTIGGTTPTATLGFVLTAGEAPLRVTTAGSLAVTVIEESAGAILQYQLIQFT